MPASESETAPPAVSEMANPSDRVPNESKPVLLRESLKPLVFVSQFTGLTFFGKVEGNKLKLIIGYRFFIFTMLVLFFVHELPTIKFWASQARGLHAMLAYVETWYRWIILFVNFILNVTHNARITGTISLLSDTPMTAEKSMYTSIYRFQIFIIAFNFFILACYMCIGHEGLWPNANYKWYTSTIYIITEFYIAFSNVQFVGVLYAIRKYFRTVNDNLRKGPFSVSAISDGTTFLFIVDGNHKQKGVLDIIKFREVHLNLSLICLKLNQCYTVQILLFLVLCLIEITYSLRSCINFIITSDKGEQNEWMNKPWLEMLLTVFWGGYYFIHLIELVSSCDFTAAESRQTSVVVHELINRVQDKNLERQLQLFSLQLMNHAACFTAGRFFQLDFALLHSMLGAVTTYLVIIITFRE